MSMKTRIKELIALTAMLAMVPFAVAAVVLNGDDGTLMRWLDDLAARVDEWRSAE